MDPVRGQIRDSTQEFHPPQPSLGNRGWAAAGPSLSTANICSFPCLKELRREERNPPSSISPLLSPFCSAPPLPPVPFPFLCHPCSFSTTNGTGRCLCPPAQPSSFPAFPPALPVLLQGAASPGERLLMASPPGSLAGLWEHQGLSAVGQELFREWEVPEGQRAQQGEPVGWNRGSRSKAGVRRCGNWECV